jgi:hypothetical protein
MILLDNVAANTTGAWNRYHGGLSSVLVTATSFGGGTVQLQVRSVEPEGTGVNLPDHLFSANGAKNLLLGQTDIRAVLSGATGPTAVRVTVSDPI